MGLKAALGRILYGLVFTLAIPLALAWWARMVPVHPPGIHAPSAGVALGVAGIVLMGVGMLALWVRGGGLPMNAFPPPRFVEHGIYGLLPHPIYIGFVLVCAGASLWSGSGPGLWLVTPLAALGCAMIVVGYEAPDLARRFPSAGRRPLLSLPREGTDPLTFGERAGCMAMVLALWVLAYETVILVGLPPDATTAFLPGEEQWPVYPSTEFLYFSAYLVVPFAFLLAPDRQTLRRLAAQGLVATGALTILYLCLPIASPMRPVPGTGLAASMLRLEQAMSQPPVAAFPSFHVLWAGLAAQALSRRGGAWRLAWVWALGIAASCITTGMHAAVDVVAGLACCVVFCDLPSLWRETLSWCERLANSWSSRRLGPLRIISHGKFAGAGAAVGVFLATWLSGSPAGIAIISLSGLVGGALWAQIIEGSPALLRPFGYYGFLFGAMGGIIACGILGMPALTLAAAMVVAGPWIQALGRLRCLVQGCCHGRPVAEGFGIHVHAAHSRVTLLSPFRGVCIHATQLYSIMGNIAIGLLLARLWVLGAPVSFIGGMYLVLSAMARFMEEAYRGEPQTKMLAGLPMYQWLAMGCIVIGMVLCVVPGPAAAMPMHLPGAVHFGLAGVIGGIAWFAMGIDFPESNRRFARLSG